MKNIEITINVPCPNCPDSYKIPVHISDAISEDPSALGQFLANQIKWIKFEVLPSCFTCKKLKSIR